MQHATETPKQYQCRHIFTDGHRCASPCLRQEEFCYYHHTTRKPIANPKQRRSRRSSFHLPLPEDRSAIQASIGEVLQRIASNDIDPRRAGLLLYGLQIASLNLPKVQPANTAESETVEEITIDPTLGVLAPRTDISEIAKRKSPVLLLIERMMQEEEERAPTPEPVTLPTVQATADNLPHTRQVTSRLRRCQSSPPTSKDVSFRPKRRKWKNPLLHLSSFKTAHLPTLTGDSYTPCPPAPPAYKRNWQSHPASDHRHESRTQGRQNPCS
jgi:hypothetical protein